MGTVRIKILEKILQVVFIIVIVSFIIYKTYIPITDNIYELTHKEAKHEYAPLNIDSDKLDSQFEILKGQNSFLIRGRMVSDCHNFSNEDYCPIWIREININGKNPYIYNDILARIENKSYTINNDCRMFLLVDKNSDKFTVFTLKSIIDYKPLDNEFAKKNNYPPILQHNQTYVFDNKIMSKPIDIDISSFQIIINETNLAINVEGHIKNLGEIVKVKVIVTALYMSKHMVVYEEKIDLRDDIFRGTFIIKNVINEVPISVVLLIESNNSYYVVEKIVENNTIKSFVYY